MSPASRLGQAYLSSQGHLYLVVSDPWIHPWVSETEWRHSMVVFTTRGGHEAFHRGEESVAEFTTRPGWTRLI